MWRENVSKKIQSKILEVQKPEYNLPEVHCPHCDSKLDSSQRTDYRKCGDCDWSVVIGHRYETEQDNWGESEDGMRPGGHSEARAVNVSYIAEGGPLPKYVPEYVNAAYKAKKSDFYFTIQTKPFFMPLFNTQEESFLIAAEYAKLFEYFPRVPEDLNPEELFTWGEENAKKIISDFSIRVSKEKDKKQ